MPIQHFIFAISGHGNVYVLLIMWAEQMHACEFPTFILIGKHYWEIEIDYWKYLKIKILGTHQKEGARTWLTRKMTIHLSGRVEYVVGPNCSL